MEIKISNKAKFCFLLTAAILFSGTSISIGQIYPEMVTVQGGVFRMGSPVNQGEKDEHPAHEVILKTCQIAKTETTVYQWKTYCKATGHKMPDPPTWEWADDQPIVNVSWQEAVDYCEWLSNQTGSKYGLPTEAEWEYAARGGQLSKGFEFSGSQTLDNSGWYSGNSNGITHPVAQRQPNELGLYDMSGNVWEWCSDWYAEDYYRGSPKDNPTGPANGSRHVVRGGSWFSAADNCTVTHHNTFTPAFRYSNYGFRVVCTK